jgi:hypothetical protein
MWKPNIAFATDVTGSRMATFASTEKPARGGFGQNGDGSASSLLPGQKLPVGNLLATLAKEVTVPLDHTDQTNFGDLSNQTRTISAAPITPSVSMKRQTYPAFSNQMNHRPVTRAATPGNYKR